MDKRSMKDIGQLYDEQFQRKMKIVQVLVQNLRNQKDIQIATKWLIRVNDIKSPNLEVKKNLFSFLTYITKVLQDSVLNKCRVPEPNTVCDPNRVLSFLNREEFDSSDQDDLSEETPCESDKKPEFHSRWSDDYRTYIAVKSIQGKGVLVYMAVSKRPGLENWDFPPRL